MTCKTLTLALAGVVYVVMALSMFNAPGPALALDPTLDAALYTIAQATAQAGQVIAAQRATAAAVSSEATRQANIAQATARALSAEATAQAFAVQSTAQAQNAQATQSAIDELTRQRAATTTAEAMNAQATRTAQEATATASAMNAQATATSQAVMIAAQATDTARLSQTYATRQQRFSWGLLIVEFGFIAGALLIIGWLTRTLVLWAKRLAPQSVSDAPNLAEVLTDSGARPAYSATQPTVIEQTLQAKSEPEPRMPSTVKVFDDPRMVEALDHWAERYDIEHLND